MKTCFQFVPLMLFVLQIGTLRADFRIDAGQMIPAWATSTSRTWFFIDVNLSTGAQVNTVTASLLPNATGTLQPTFTHPPGNVTRNYPWVRMYVHATGTSSGAASTRMPYYYIVARDLDNPSSEMYFGGPALENEDGTWSPADPPTTVYIPPENAPGITPNLGTSVGGAEYGGAPPPPDPPPGTPGPGPVTTTEGGGGTVPAGFDRWHKLELNISNSSTSPETYVVTIRNGAGGVVQQWLEPVSAGQTVNLVFWYEDPTYTIDAQLVAVGNEATTGGTIEGTVTPWNINTGQNPNTVGGTTIINPTTPPPTTERNESNDANEEARHNEAQTARARIEQAIKDAGDKVTQEVRQRGLAGITESQRASAEIKSAIQAQTTSINSAADAASQQIQNSIEFVGGVLVDSLDGIKDAVESIEIAPGEPATIEVEEVPSEVAEYVPGALGSLPTETSGLASSVDSGGAGFLSGVQGVRDAADNVMTAVRDLVDGLGLDSTLPDEPLQFQLDTGTTKFGVITLDLHSFAGSYISHIRIFILFLLSIAFVWQLTTTLREGFA